SDLSPAPSTDVHRGSRKLPPELRDGVGGLGQRHRNRLAPAPDLHLELARGERATPDRDAQRTAERLVVGELLPRARVAIVVEGLQAGVLELPIEAVGELALLAAGLAQYHQLDVERGDRPRPRDPLLSGVLLARGSGGTSRPEAVGAHPDQPGLARLVQIVGPERLRITRPELEDVADLDRRLDPHDAAVDRVARPDQPHVDRLIGEVAARLDGAQV